jgi:osmotically-inducible protein OsmY
VLFRSVSSEKVKSEAETIARGTRGVRDVHNELLVGNAKY